MISDDINDSEYCFDDCTIESLPDEILENILSYVAPYDDLQCCAAVSKRFHGIVKSVIRHTKRKFQKSISEFNVEWDLVTTPLMTIARRYSHSACLNEILQSIERQFSHSSNILHCENCMYVFGGCTPTGSTFNDLWCLNLNTRQWERPLTVGSYPSPKAYTTLVSHDHQLILFGGWTHPSPFPLHQPWKLFNELHVYDIPSSRWINVATVPSPPALAGHSATMQGRLMVVFGGVLQSKHGGHERVSCNAIWCFDTETHAWSQPATSHLKPPPRYGQFQVALDDAHLLIIGGCGGPNMVFKDVWLLTLGEPEWTWQMVKVHNPQWAAPHIWCHPTCKVEKFVVVFSRSRQLNSPAIPQALKWNTPSQMRVPASPPSHRMPRDPAGVCYSVAEGGLSGTAFLTSEFYPVGTSDFICPPQADVMKSMLTMSAHYVMGPGVETKRSPESPSSSRDHNVNGRRGHFLHRPGVASTSSSSGEESETEASPGNLNIQRARHSSCDEKVPSMSVQDDFAAGPGTITMSAFRVPDSRGSPTANRNRNRIRQLESLRKYEDRLRSLSRENAQARSPRVNRSASAMTMFVLDISKVLTEECFVEWLQHKNTSNGEPEETSLCSLISGKGELVMFGGIQIDVTSLSTESMSNINDHVSNNLYFITTPHDIS
ncbi:hypothetical protein PR048_022916 [Dryococelus australis]|uniref:F-box domain-containing protein n=1 Tax=Dryococelus australis TaxID=614101 RepID=A0ABQ9GSL0_9NEOP|nr:hypothetical protein PR048_022916 [Dryococelus australis]